MLFDYSLKGAILSQLLLLKYNMASVVRATRQLVLTGYMSTKRHSQTTEIAVIDIHTSTRHIIQGII